MQGKMEMCRVCLSTENELLPLNETLITNYNILTNLNITLLDGIPQHSCQSCIKTIEYFVEFREKCISSEATLREIIESKYAVNKTDDTSVTYPECKTENKIKEEIEIKYENDDLLFDSCNFEYEYEEVSNKVLRDNDALEKVVKKPKSKKKKRSKAAVVDDNEWCYAGQQKAKKTKDSKKCSKPAVISEDIPKDDKLFCGLCSKTFESSMNIELNKHLDVHTKDVNCSVCNDTLVNIPQRLAHRLAHVPTPQKRCHICSRRFVSCMYLEFHLRNTHFKTEGSRLYCNQCNSSFASPKRLAIHLREHHTEKKFICDYCSKGFHDKHRLRAHIGSHSTKKLFVCDLCGFSCNFVSGLRSHKMRKHNPNRVYCKCRSYPFRSQEDYDKHKCRQYKHMILLCPICGKQFERNRRLNTHMLSHTNIKRFECNQCPAKFKSRTALVVHKNRHEGKRTHQCEYCPAKFYSQCVLIKHRRTHTGEKPYVCKICKKGFTGGHNLKVHMKVHGLDLVVKKDAPKEDVTSLV